MLFKDSTDRGNLHSTIIIITIYHRKVLYCSTAFIQLVTQNFSHNVDPTKQRQEGFV